MKPMARMMKKDPQGTWESKPFPMRSCMRWPVGCLVGVLLGFAVTSCGTPTARVEIVPSDKPIIINLNVKIDHEVRVKVEKELDEVFSKDSKLF